MTEIFHYATDDAIATITWDLPGASMNVLNEQGIRELDAHVDTALADTAIKGVIITSAKKDFAGGMDLNVIARMKAEAERSGGNPAGTIFGFVMQLHGILRKIERAGTDPKTKKGGKPIVWASPRTAAGIGLELGLACHRRIAADNPKAKIGLPEILVGLFPGAGGTTRLSRMRSFLALFHRPLWTGSPARLTTPSAPFSSLSGSGPRFGSHSTQPTPAPNCFSSRAALRPVTTTSSPRARSASTRRAPTKPLPPTTSTFMAPLSSPLSQAVSGSGGYSAAQGGTPMDWQKVLEWLKHAGLAYGPSVGFALLTLVAGWIAAKIIRGVLRRVMLRARLDVTLAAFAANLVYFVLLTFVIVSVLAQIGVHTGSFIAIVGAAGLAIGFALQGSLSNFASGVMLILFRPFRAGDFVEVGGVAGSVEEVQVFSTVLTTPDNKRIILPNSSVMGGTITNYSATGTRRVDMVFGIGYGDDIKKAKEILIRILEEHPAVLKDPAPVVAVGELADSSVNFIVRPWTSTPDYWTVHNDVTETVKVQFDANDISIPFPQRDLHMHQVA